MSGASDSEGVDPEPEEESDECIVCGCGPLPAYRIWKRDHKLVRGPGYTDEIGALCQFCATANYSSYGPKAGRASMDDAQVAAAKLYHAIEDSLDRRFAELAKLLAARGAP